METRTDPRVAAPRAVDLRRGRTPEVEILACETYDLLLSLHVALASPEFDYADYDVGRQWAENARAACAAEDPQALVTLGRYLGDGRPDSLRSTLISLVHQCPPPRDVPTFLEWLRVAPSERLAEALLDQENLGPDWRNVMTRALRKSQPAASSARNENPLRALLERYPDEVMPTITEIITDIEGVRAKIIAALHVWDRAVFAAEREKVTTLQRREAETLERRRLNMPLEPFIAEAMRGVQFQRPSGLRRIIFAPSYFCRPAVFYHYWQGILTFCTPIEAQVLEPDADRRDPRAPSPEMLQFFLALGDESRLRILGLLSEREMYLTELAEKLGLTKATTKHHMVKLREYGLVTLIDRDRLTYYALRPDVAEHAAHLLDQFLYRSARP
jgi:DNA-binding transcriptional ArsR family regulator